MKLHESLEQWRILKNFFAANFAICCCYASLGGVGSIQFVLMEDKRLALIAQIVVFISQLATSFVIPQVMLDIVGIKYGVVISHTLILSFIVVQVVPNSWTLLPSNRDLS